MKRVGLLIILIMMFSMTGCIQKYEFTEAESDKAAEYMAGLLLKYDKSYDKELIPMEELTGENDVATPTGSTANQEKAPVTNAATDQNAVSQDTTDQTTTGIPAAQGDYTLSEVFGEKGFELNYTSYQIVDSYPENATNETFSVTPRQGDQLLVASFALTNTLNKKRSLDLSKSSLTYVLEINAEKLYAPSLTLMENDLKYLNMQFQGGEKKSVILVFEIKKETSWNKMNLTISNGDKSELISMK